MQSIGSGRRGTRGLVVLAAAAIAVLALAACGGGSGSSSNSSSTSSAPAQQGGTAYFAEGTQAAPNYIFPFASLPYFSTTNFQGFINLMYRPLYWFGKGATPNLNLSLSLADAPQYSNGGKTITVTLKPYKWSNGETVTAQDVVFWMNMMKVEKLNWAGYAAGTIPDDVASVDGEREHAHVQAEHEPRTRTGTRTTSSRRSRRCRWRGTSRRRARSPQLCGTASYAGGDDFDQDHVEGHDGHAGLRRGEVVRSRLRLPRPGEAKKACSSYDVEPALGSRRRPVQAPHFDTTGNVTFVPNKTYSGPVKPKLDEVRRAAVHLGRRRVQRARRRQGRRRLSSRRRTSRRTRRRPARAASSRGRTTRVSRRTTTSTRYAWEINYFPYNFNSTGNGGQAGKIFRQLYFRQAFQMLVDQPALHPAHRQGLRRADVRAGAGLPEEQLRDLRVEAEQPVSVQPDQGDAAPHSRTAGRSKPGGTSTCADAAKCGVPAGNAAELQPPVRRREPVRGPAHAGARSRRGRRPGSRSTCRRRRSTRCSAGGAVLRQSAARGSSATGAAAGSSRRTTTRPASSFSRPAPARTRAATPTRPWTPDQGHDVRQLRPQRVRGLRREAAAGRLAAAAVTATEINKKLQGVLPLNALLNINPENWYFTK